MNIKIRLLVFFFILSGFCSIAQDKKQESEQAIKKRKLPAEILRSAEPFLQDASRLRYYYETDGDNESYEIKGRIEKKDYSVEYRKDGTLIDIEKLIDFEEIQEQVRNSISGYLQEKYDKYVFTRVQQQYFPQENEDDADEVLEDFKEKDLEDFEIRYELEVDTRAGNELGSFELLFDSNGKLLEKREIVRRAEDNIYY
jgi:hypothetical protein